MALMHARGRMRACAQRSRDIYGADYFFDLGLGQHARSQQ
jgi:hypothetical protein